MVSRKKVDIYKEDKKVKSFKSDDDMIRTFFLSFSRLLHRRHLDMSKGK